MSRRVFVVLAVLLSLVPGLYAQLPEAELARRRERILEIGRAYASHRWSAGEASVFHGVDEQGVRVDTPDRGFRPDGWLADGSENVGIPYQWGGFASLQEFDAGVAAGRWAGHIPGEDSLLGSAGAVGVDCSGFLSRCWELPVKHSTRSLGELCIELDDWKDLRPGDLINKFDQHAMLFQAFVDGDKTEVSVIEAGLPRVVESVYPVSKLEDAGFLPMRYQPLGDDWDALVLPAASFVIADRADRGAWVTGPEPVEGELPSGGWGSAARDDWARYALAGDDPDGPSLELTLAVTGRPEGALAVQKTQALGDFAQQTSVVLDAAPSWPESVLALFSTGQEAQDVRCGQVSVARGSYALSGRTFDARRIEADLTCSYRLRGRELPARLHVSAVQSDELPLAGVLSLVLTSAIEIEDRTQTSESRRTLLAFQR